MELSANLTEQKPGLLDRGIDLASLYLMYRHAKLLRKVEKLPPEVQISGRGGVEFARGEYHLNLNNGWRLLDEYGAQETFSASISWGDGASPIVVVRKTVYDREGVAREQRVFDSQLQDLTPHKNTLSSDEANGVLSYARKLAAAKKVKLAA